MSVRNGDKAVGPVCFECRGLVNGLREVDNEVAGFEVIWFIF